MEHPLTYPYLTPIGFVFSRYAIRVKHVIGENKINGDYEAAYFWQKRNHRDDPEVIPAEYIIHHLMPSLSNRGKTTKGDFVFRDKPYMVRDIKVLSTFMQWFGTNCGWCFVDAMPCGFDVSHPRREHIEKFAHENKQDKLIAGLLHVCTDECTKFHQFPHGCTPSSKDVTERDRIVAHALMYWLGTNSGRDYMAGYKNRIRRISRRALQAARERQESFRLVS